MGQNGIVYAVNVDLRGVLTTAIGVRVRVGLRVRVRVRARVGLTLGQLVMP